MAGGALVFVDDVLQYEDTGTDPRWIGNGRTLLDNKGNPIKQYEPHYSSTDEYEDEARASRALSSWFDDWPGRDLWPHLRCQGPTAERRPRQRDHDELHL